MQIERRTIEIFISLFLFTFIITNWSEVSWIFNYREVEGLVSDFFNPYPDAALALVDANKTAPALIAPGAVPTPSAPVVAIQAQYPYSQEADSIQIPSISVNTPVVIAQSTNKTSMARDLDKGAVYYPGSVLPAETGQIVILGHSAPPNWPRIKHDYIFSNIGTLESGAQIILTFNNRKYTYQVISKKVVERGEDVSSIQTTDNILTLISCWPPGKDYQRITVTAKLVPA